MGYRLWLLGLLMLLLTQSALWIPAPRVVMAAPGTTVLAVDGSIAFQSAPISLAVSVRNVQQLGAATIVVQYDPAVLAPTGCRRGDQFGLGLCNLSLDLNGDGTFDAVRFNALAISGVTVAADALVPLALIDWKAANQDAVGTTTTLTVTIDTLTDGDGVPISAVAQNGKVTILPVASPTITPPSVHPIFLPLVKL